MPILPLQVEGIVLRRGGRQVLGPLSWVLAGQGITIILGPNGSGKTSFLRAMHGLERINEGALHWSAPADVVNARQAFVFQTPIMMRRSVLRCIVYPLLVSGLAKAAAYERAAQAAAQVGLGDLLNQPAQRLSGGEKQKLALARALIRAPEVLFLDEPCANLDDTSTREIETVLCAARDAGTRIVMSTHDLGQARRLACDVVFLHNGRLVEAGPKSTTLEYPNTPELANFVKGNLLL